MNETATYREQQTSTLSPDTDIAGMFAGGEFRPADGALRSPVSDQAAGPG